MSKSKKHLSNVRTGTVINNISSKEEKTMMKAVRNVMNKLKEKYPTIELRHEKKQYLMPIYEYLVEHYPDDEFEKPLESSFITPDGGFLHATINGQDKIILIGEVKNQGTNDIRLLEGKKKQAKGNAIERLGKNVIGIEMLLIDEPYNPFVTFGDGCDFAEGSSIRDRVLTINGLRVLGKININNTRKFDTGSYFFRSEKWTEEEMTDIMFNIADTVYSKYIEKGN